MIQTHAWIFRKTVAAKSLAKKLAKEAKPGSIIFVTDEEWEALQNDMQPFPLFQDFEEEDDELHKVVCYNCSEVITFTKDELPKVSNCPNCRAIINGASGERP